MNNWFSFVAEAQCGREVAPWGCGKIKTAKVDERKYLLGIFILFAHTNFGTYILAFPFIVCIKFAQINSMRNMNKQTAQSYSVDSLAGWLLVACRALCGIDFPGTKKAQCLFTFYWLVFKYNICVLQLLFWSSSKISQCKTTTTLVKKLNIINNYCNSI